ncbi:MAG: long-chain fatty acid--CoA ligase [Burkholderiales bacterium PBB1]|nr:MAG: long-chain fatty acid--CoA ligase [Burkholderiales bacterium PBB1]
MPILSGQMMQMPLSISSLLRHAARHAGDVEVVSRRVEGDLHRTTYVEVERRARQVAQALARLGCALGERVGTLAWNGHRHLELFYGISGSGRVCHTINPRLHAEQIAWIINHAQDRVLCFDLTFLPLVEQLAPQIPSVAHWVLMTDRGHMPASSSLESLLCYEELLAAEDGHWAWPEFDENTASGLCYTSGTTGMPKGVLYSHRSTVLHALGQVSVDAMGIGSRDVVLPVTPMFHVNAWGVPFAAPMVGAKLVFPGPRLDGASLHELMESERVTFTAGVPTVWLGLITHMKKLGLSFSTLRRTVIGGAACPPAMMRTLEDDFGLEVIHAWGMTETSPLGTLAHLKAKHASLDAEARRLLQQKQGKVIYGVDLTIVDANDQPLPWDGRTAGQLLVRGHWVVDRYLGAAKNGSDSPHVDVAGERWFPTGDVATIDADGYMQITDRSKDVIKSGGEWISSIVLENIAMAHPAVHEAAAIACHHPKWDERPLLIVVCKPGAEPSAQELLRFFDGKVAAWQVPDDVVFVDELPHTATGKLLKMALRDTYRDHRLPGV